MCLLVSTSINLNTQHDFTFAWQVPSDLSVNFAVSM
jgi:hypothetical protein